MEPIQIAQAGQGFWDSTEAPATLEQEVLPAYVPGCRWFGGKARGEVRFTVEAITPLGGEEDGVRLVLVGAGYGEGPAETYLLPLRIGPGAAEAVAVFRDGAGLVEATEDEGFRRALMALVAGEKALEAAGATLRGERGPGLPAGAETLPSRVLKVEQSNSSLLYGDAVFVKLFRKLEDGMNPDVEITRFLNEAGCACVPPFAGAVLRERPGREPQVLALALGMVPNVSDAWTQTLGEVRAFYERVLGVMMEAPNGPAWFGADEGSPALRELAGAFGQRVRQLGVRTGEMHLALASAPAGHGFAPERFTAEDQGELSSAVCGAAEKIFELLARTATDDPAAESLRQRQPEVMALAEGIAAEPLETTRTRTHGDYHLGQVLNTGTDYVIIDFEGEPQRSLAERQRKRSPLRDVAGMLRSFHYAAHSGLGDFPAEGERLSPWAEAWSAMMSRMFLQAWLETCSGAVFLPRETAGVERLLKAFLLEKAIYEVGYELNNRPAWVGIPTRGILQILGA